MNSQINLGHAENNLTAMLGLPNQTPVRRGLRTDSVDFGVMNGGNYLNANMHFDNNDGEI